MSFSRLHKPQKGTQNQKSTHETHHPHRPLLNSQSTNSLLPQCVKYGGEGTEKVKIEDRSLEVGNELDDSLPVQLRKGIQSKSLKNLAQSAVSVNPPNVDMISRVIAKQRTSGRLSFGEMMALQQAFPQSTTTKKRQTMPHMSQISLKSILNKPNIKIYPTTQQAQPSQNLELQPTDGNPRLKSLMKDRVYVDDTPTNQNSIEGEPIQLPQISKFPFVAAMGQMDDPQSGRSIQTLLKGESRRSSGVIGRVRKNVLASRETSQERFQKQMLGSSDKNASNRLVMNKQISTSNSPDKCPVCRKFQSQQNPKIPEIYKVKNLQKLQRIHKKSETTKCNCKNHLKIKAKHRKLGKQKKSSNKNLITGITGAQNFSQKPKKLTKKISKILDKPKVDQNSPEITPVKILRKQGKSDQNDEIGMQIKSFDHPKQITSNIKDRTPVKDQPPSPDKPSGFKELSSGCHGHKFSLPDISHNMLQVMQLPNDNNDQTSAVRFKSLSKRMSQKLIHHNLANPRFSQVPKSPNSPPAPRSPRSPQSPQSPGSAMKQYKLIGEGKLKLKTKMKSPQQVKRTFNTNEKLPFIKALGEGKVRKGQDDGAEESNVREKYFKTKGKSLQKHHSTKSGQLYLSAQQATTDKTRNESSSNKELHHLSHMSIYFHDQTQGQPPHPDAPIVPQQNQGRDPKSRGSQHESQLSQFPNHPSLPLHPSQPMFESSEDLQFEGSIFDSANKFMYNPNTSQTPVNPSPEAQLGQVVSHPDRVGLSSVQNSQNMQNLEELKKYLRVVFQNPIENSQVKQKSKIGQQLNLGQISQIPYQSLGQNHNFIKSKVGNGGVKGVGGVGGSKRGSMGGGSVKMGRGAGGGDKEWDGNDENGQGINGGFGELEIWQMDHNAVECRRSQSQSDESETSKYLTNNSQIPKLIRPSQPQSDSVTGTSTSTDRQKVHTYKSQKLLQKVPPTTKIEKASKTPKSKQIGKPKDPHEMTISGWEQRN